MKKTSFSTMVDVINKKTEYDELVHESGLSIPKKYLELNTTSAEWCIQKLRVFNSQHPRKDHLIDLCKEYLSLIEENNNIKFIVE